MGSSWENLEEILETGGWNSFTSYGFQHSWPRNANREIPPGAPVFSGGMSGMPGALHSLCPVNGAFLLSREP